MIMLRKIFLYIKKRFLFEDPLFVLFSFSEERNDAQYHLKFRHSERSEESQSKKLCSFPFGGKVRMRG